MGFIADIDTASIRMYHFQTQACALDFSHHLPALLALHFVPVVRRRMVGGFLGFLLWFGFHANLSMANSTCPGPVGASDSIPSSGSGRSPVQGSARHHPHNP